MSNETIYTKHKHHIIPKHMGGTDDPSNLIELTVEEHAEAHRVLYEKYGRWEDELAWKGLSGMMSKQEIIKRQLSEAGRKGAEMTNIKRGAKKWDRVNKYNSDYPEGVDGRKIRAKRFWFTNGISESQFSLEDYPEGWSRGRKKGR